MSEHTLQHVEPEQRADPRVQLGQVEIRRGNAEVPLIADTEDLSAGGCCVALANELGLYTAVDVLLRLNDKTPPIPCRGKINWTMARVQQSIDSPTTYSTGIQFIQVAEEDRLRIAQAVRRQMQVVSEASAE